MSDFSDKFGKKLAQDYFDEYGNYKFPNQFKSDIPNTALPPTKKDADQKCKQFKDLLEHSLFFGFIHWEYELPNYIERAKRLKNGANIIDYFVDLEKTINFTKQLYPSDNEFEKHIIEINPHFYQILAESIHCLDFYEKLDKNY